MSADAPALVPSELGGPWAVTEQAQPVRCTAEVIRGGTAPTMSSDYRIVLVRGGAAQVYGDFGVRLLRSGQVLVVGAGTAYGLVALDTLSAICVELRPGYVADQLRWAMPTSLRSRKHTKHVVARAIGDVRALALDARDREKMDATIDRLLAATEGGRARRGALVTAAGLVWLIAELVAPHGVHTPTLEADRAGVALRPEVRRVLRALHENPSNPWTMPELAQLASLSESALRRAFQRAIGDSPRRYLQHLRLTRFEELVRGTTMPIEEATRRAGWTSTAHARRTFKREHGVSPREGRAQPRSDVRGV